MSKKKIFTWPVIILILLAPFILNIIYSGVSTVFGLAEGRVRDKIENYLYDKYGEEFIVDRIGTRSSRDETFYQARIYPRSIIGTNKEMDEYYYASASVDMLPFGMLGGVGDSYSYVYRNMDVENYLLPEAKEIFGERILMKVDVAHKVTGDGSWWAGYKSSNLAEMRKDVKEDPQHNRIELNLDLYIFDRIDDDKEKEERRQQIFDYVQYLKKEEFFEFLEMGVIFMDERVLAPGYRRYAYEIKCGKKYPEKVEGKTVYLPSDKLRKEVSRVLQQEVDKMNEEELLVSMGKIKKDYTEDLAEFSCQYVSFVYSLGILKAKYSSSITEEDNNRDYTELNHVVISKNLKYIY